MNVLMVVVLAGVMVVFVVVPFWSPNPPPRAPNRSRSVMGAPFGVWL